MAQADLEHPCREGDKSAHNGQQARKERYGIAPAGKSDVEAFGVILSHHDVVAIPLDEELPAEVA